MTKHLGRAEESLKKTRAERVEVLWANEELGQAVAKKDVDVKKVREELTKTQALVTEYLMKEEEIICKTGKTKEESKACGNHKGSIRCHAVRRQKRA